MPEEKNEVETTINPEPQAMQQPVVSQGMQPVAQPVQYMVMQQSLKGVGGWLIFWMIVFAFAAIGYITAFFTSMMSLNSAVSIISLIFAPVLAAGYVTSVVFMAMQKKLAKMIIFITLGVSALYTIINSIVGYITVSNTVRSYSSYDYSYSSSSAMDRALPMLIAGILISLLVHALIALYFILSKRVKETLVN